MFQNLPDTCDLTSTGDDTPRYFIDTKLDAGTDDADWWLDLGAVDVPVQMAG